MRIRCFNVGQGNSLLVELPTDQNHEEPRFGVIDCFYNKARSDEPKVLSYLKSRNIKNLEFIILTHPDYDHCAGLSKVLDYFTSEGRTFKTYIESLYDCETVRSFNFIRKKHNNSVLRPTPYSEELQLIADKTSSLNAKGTAKFKYESLGHAFGTYALSDDLTVQFVAPNNRAFLGLKKELLKGYVDIEAGKATGRLDLNNISLAFILKWGQAKTLICGDVTNRVWSDVIPESRSENVDMQSHFILVTHHGADTGNPQALWEAIAIKESKKSVAVISCGYQNRYEHPSEKTLNRILSKKATLYCLNLGKPCTTYDVLNDPNSSILDRAIQVINKDPFDKAMEKIGHPVHELCSGETEFEISPAGDVKVLYREQLSYCAYAAAYGFENKY